MAARCTCWRPWPPAGRRRGADRGRREDERDPDDHPPARWPEPGQGCRDGRCSPHPARHRDDVHGRGADFVLPVKDNQPGLFDALDALPWHRRPGHPRRHRPRPRPDHHPHHPGHGRAPRDLPFPHVSQVYLIERHVSGLDGNPLSDVAALGVTSLAATRPPRDHRRARPRPVASSPCTGSATPFTAKTTPPSAPAPGPAPWPPQEPRNRRPAPGRPTRHHRGDPLGQPLHGAALHHPRTHVMILKRPWLFPAFNMGEASVSSGLTEEEKHQLAGLLRKIIRSVEGGGQATTVGGRRTVGG